MRAGRISRAVVACTVVAGLAAAPALADPKSEEPFALECDNGESYTVVTNGNGDWTPAHDTASTTTFVPLSFGTFHAVITDSSGNVVDTFDEPPSAKGQSGKNAKDTISCSFTFSGTEDGFTFTASGTVTGYATPRGGK